MKSEVAIIGGSGFIGSRLIHELGAELCYNIDNKQDSMTFETE